MADETNLIRCGSISPEYGWRCGLYAGHKGNHTVLIPSDAPWFDANNDPEMEADMRYFEAFGDIGSVVGFSSDDAQDDEDDQPVTPPTGY